MTLSTRLRAGIAALGAFLVAACGGAASTTATSSSSGGNHPNLSGKTINFIYDGTPSLATMNLDHAQKTLEGWGATVHVTYSDNTQVVFGAILQGDADVMEFSAQGALSGIGSGMDLKAFALVNPRMDYAFIGRPGIKSLKDLKGAKIGVLDTVGLNGIQAEMVIKAAGLKDGDVSLVKAGGQGNRVAALLAGRIDATMVGFANWLQLQSQGYHLLYSYTKEQPQLYDDILWAKPSWLSSHKEEAIAINQAIIEGMRWINDKKNKDAFVAEATALIKGLDAGIAGQMYDIYLQNNMFPPNAILDENALAYNQAQYVQYKSLNKSIPVKQWADVSYAQQALQREGRI